MTQSNEDQRELMRNRLKLMRDRLKLQGVVIITAKAPPMTEEELERASRPPMFVDYIGLLR